MVIGDDVAASHPYIQMTQEAWNSGYHCNIGQKHLSGVVHFYRNGWIYRCSDGKFVDHNDKEADDPFNDNQMEE